MKHLKRIGVLLTASFMLMLMLALPAYAGDLEEQAPVKLTIEGLTGQEVMCGSALTFKASGGTAGQYVLVLEVDGNPARFLMGPRGEKTLRVGSMDNDGTVLPIGVNYQAYVIRAGGHNCEEDGCREYEAAQSEKQPFSVTYAPCDDYKLEVQGAIRYYDKYHEQWAVEKAPTLYHMTDGQWVEFLDPEALGAVYRYKITDESGRVVSMDGMIKDPGAYTVEMWELFEDPFTGKIVQAKGNTVVTRMSPISVDPGMLDGGKGTVGPDVSVDPDMLGGGPTEGSANEEHGIQLLVGDASQEIIASADQANSVPSDTAAEIPASAAPSDTAAEIQTAAAPTDTAAPSDAPVPVVKSPANNSSPSAASVKKPAAVKAPGKTKITALQNKKSRKVVLKFKKVAGARGYEIVYGTNKNLKKGAVVKRTNKTTLTLNKLKKNKVYYFKVRAYKVNAAGKRVYGKYTAVRSVRIKK